ncbi:MAG TPA: sigma-54 dependent transcriptional regulator [Bacteroidota bacterium]|nr:sigma-54 dependent transcriptional regulator [Bacteroidota bacterium]
MAFQEEHKIIGQSLEMQEIVEVIQQVAPTDITVLISGESGVGKEIVAQAIHAASRRANKPIVTVNCGAIPEGIIESELFGHEKGSFTGASDSRKGYFELADGGTIFLDEIGELPLATQVKFLRILENGEFMRVGSSTAKKVDVRVIAATNKDLEREVYTKHFRPDLFYRLRSVNIRIPPLRDRREDIPVFFTKFAKEFAEKNAITFLGITDEAMELLSQYYWPGNVRELRNVVESMLVIENGKKLTAEDVRKYLKGAHPNGEERNLPVYVPRSSELAERELIYRALVDLKTDIVDVKNLLVNADGASSALVRRNGGGAAEIQEGAIVQPRAAEEENISLEEMERRMIIGSLQKYEGNRRLAAQALKISERTLYRKIKEYGLQ